MESQSFLPIPYFPGSKPAISRGLEKNANSSAISGTSFPDSLNESIIDVYERQEINAFAPDERSGFDRRTSPTRRRSTAESAPLQSGKKAADAGIYSTQQKANQTFNNKTENTMPALFSPSQKKGSLLDIWA